MAIRKEKRLRAYKPVLIHGFDDARGAASMDYGQYGLGIVTIFELSEGDVLTVSCPDFWPETRQGTVVWVRPESPSSRRAGVQLY